MGCICNRTGVCAFCKLQATAHAWASETQGDNAAITVVDTSGQRHLVRAAEIRRVYKHLTQPVCFKDLRPGDRFKVKAFPDEGVWGKCPTYKRLGWFGVQVNETLAVQVDPPTYKLLEVWKGVEVLPCP